MDECVDELMVATFVNKIKFIIILASHESILRILCTRVRSSVCNLANLLVISRSRSSI